MTLDRLAVDTAPIGHYLVRSTSETIYVVHIGLLPDRDVHHPSVYRKRAPGSSRWAHDNRWIVPTRLISYLVSEGREPQAEVQEEFRVGWRPRIWVHTGEWIIARETTSIEPLSAAEVAELGVAARNDRHSD